MRTRPYVDPKKSITEIAGTRSAETRVLQTNHKARLYQHSAVSFIQRLLVQRSWSASHNES